MSVGLSLIQAAQKQKHTNKNSWGEAIWDLHISPFVE
jgi:hypothetical protein